MCQSQEDAMICSGHCPSKEIENSGCLYTGDVNLKQPDIIKDLKSKLSTFYECIGTLQVPHHGSFRNFDNSVLNESNIKCAVVSYGHHNCYGHPSNDVIDAII
jgi:beta-lactamase superfamily II metal-dependent hydrolase